MLVKSDELNCCACHIKETQASVQISVQISLILARCHSAKDCIRSVPWLQCPLSLLCHRNDSITTHCSRCSTLLVRCWAGYRGKLTPKTCLISLQPESRDLNMHPQGNCRA